MRFPREREAPRWNLALSIPDRENTQTIQVLRSERVESLSSACCISVVYVFPIGLLIISDAVESHHSSSLVPEGTADATKGKGKIC